MAARPAFRLNRKGVRAILRTQTREAVNDLAAMIADRVRDRVDDDVEVTVEEYTTDRGAAAVTIRDERGAELQITRGALTQAASSLGLEVRS